MEAASLRFGRERDGAELERQGIATVAIQLLREVAERVGPTYEIKAIQPRGHSWYWIEIRYRHADDEPE